MATLLVTVDEKEDFEVEFSGSTYEDLLKAIKEELPSDLLSPGQDIAPLQIFSEKFSKFIRLNPKKVETTVKNGSHLKVTLTPSTTTPGTEATGSDTGATGSDTGATGSDTGAAGRDTGATGSDTGATSSDKIPRSEDTPKELKSGSSFAPFQRTWSTDSLIAWLSERGLSAKDCDKLRDDEFTGESFILLEKSDIKELGIKISGQMLLGRILEEIKKEEGIMKDNFKIWKGIDKLKVYFMNPEDMDEWGWMCRGEPMNINTVIAWARVWNTVQYPEIPMFEVTWLPNKADIRVKFSANGGNWSMVGTEAQTVTDLKKPTLQLNLKGHSPELQESMVVHQFGHALGLEHEHQRSDFWDVLEKHLDVEKMKSDHHVNPSQSEEGRAAFGRDWFKQIEKPGVRTVNSLSEYDPESIMHYWFDTNWIKEVTLRTYENIDHDLRLDPKEKQYLKGLHERSQKGQLTRRPTLRDYRVLVEAYGGAPQSSQTFPLKNLSVSSGDKPKGISKGGMAANACIGKIWKGRDKLKVFFMNPDDMDEWGWKCRGEPMNVNTVIAWARVWNTVQCPEIPVFEMTQVPRKADIRVQFSANGGNWSMVGTEAQTVTDLKKPTLQLNLKGHSPELQESMVVHKFGHALGLEHEHQRSDFWDVLEKHLDVEKMKSDPRVNPSQSEEGRAAFGRDWFKQIEKPGVRTVNSLSEYDPESIMHYWFDTNWIKEKTLRTYENIDRDLRLDPKEKQYLKGLHERSQKGQLTRRPSLRDYRVLVEAYATSKEKFWNGRDKLKVYFMNPDDIDEWEWKCRGEPMNINTVIAWARVWNFVQYPEIPMFEVTQLANKADIRVKFSANGGNWSMVGTEAQTVTDLKKPTLQLNLKGHSPELQESMVVHNFGHALGLEHKHQRSDFWDVLEKHLDVEKIKNDPHMNPSQSRAAFGRDWFKQIEKPGVQTVNSLSENDPESIMHYWFDTNWIKEKTLRTYENIDRDLHLSPKEKQYLKGLHERSQKGQLTRRPSLRDYKVLVEAYGGKFVESSPPQALVDILRAPDKAKQAASTDSVLRVNTHLKHIRNAVWDVRADWRRLGGELELTTGTLDAIDIDCHNSGDKLGAVLERWMYTGKAKIHDLLNALESAPVGRPDIAKQILKYEGTDDAKKYGFATSSIKFQVHPEDVISKLGLNLRFTVKTLPTAKIYMWYFKNKPVSTEDGSYEGVETDTLSITNLLPRHRGAYYCMVTSESNEVLSSRSASLLIDGEKLKQNESKLLGEILKASKIDFSGSGIDIELLLDGNSDQLTYEEIEFVMRENPITQILSMDLKQELQSRLKEEELYQEAIANERTVSLSYLKILALGPGQIGKSTFLYRLLGLMDGNIETASSETLPSCSTGQADLRDVCIKFINMTGAVTTSITDNVTTDQNWESCGLQSQVEGLMRLLAKQTRDNSSEALDSTVLVTSTPGSRDVRESSQDEESPQADRLLDQNKMTLDTTDQLQDKTIPEQPEEVKTPNTSVEQTSTLDTESTPIRHQLVPLNSTQLVKKVIEEYKKLRDKCKRSTNVTKLHMLFNIADVGGQPAFLDMLPSLTIGPALYLLFSKLVNNDDKVLSIEDLTAQQTVKYRTESDASPQDCRGYSYTLQEVVFSALSSIACFGLSDKEVDKYVTEKKSGAQKTSSLAMLLGTFADRIDNDQQAKLEETESDLKELLEKTHFCKKNLISFPNPEHHEHKGGKVFFRVNNKTGSKKEITDYREIIQNLIEEEFHKYDIPTSWLGLGICMKILAKDKSTYKVSFDDCVQMGGHLKMTEEKVKAALNFLHKYIGLVMYFPNDEHLKQLVICDPQVVFSSVSELTFNVYDSTSRGQRKVEVKAQQKKFERTGIFSPDTVEYVSESDKESSKFLSCSDLVHLLVHLNIAAEIPSTENSSATSQSKEYFLPAILKTADSSTLEMKYGVSNKELLPEPLCIRFQTGYIPMGFSCALSARLIAEKDFTLLTDSEEPELYKNKLKFCFDGRFTVIMISLPLRCEFHVTRHSGVDEFHEQDCCPEILKAIRKAADSVLKSMKKTLVTEFNYDLAFKCPLLETKHQRVQFGHEPLAKIIYTDNSQSKLKQIQCVECKSTLKENYPGFKPNMRVWFGESSDIPLEITMHPTMTSKNTIEVTAEGTTPLQYQWLSGTRKLKDGEKFEGSATSKLVIKTTGSLYEGCYVCTVEDKHGKLISSEEIDFFVEEMRRHKLEDSAKKLKKAGVKSMEELGDLDVSDLNQLDLNLGEKKRMKKFRGLMSLESVVKSSINGLTLAEVRETAKDARSQWFSIGIELDLDLEKLKVIRSKHCYDTDKCFTEMLSHWLSRSSSPPTMAALHRALMSPVIGRAHLASPDLVEAIKPDSEDDTNRGGLTLKKVRRAAWEARSKWEHLGVELGVDKETLNALERTNHFVVDDCFTEMISQWLTKSPTWPKLVEALKSNVIGREALANDIHAKFCEQKQT